MGETGARIEKSVRVNLPVERAFALFTTGIADWWPLSTHSVTGDDAVAVTMELRQGGRIFETTTDGTEHLWGTVLEWHPPERVSFTFHPGRNVSAEQVVTVTFEPAEEGGTVVTLIHTGWDISTEEGRARYDGYDTGWDLVLCDRFTAAALRSSSEA